MAASLQILFVIQENSSIGMACTQNECSIHTMWVKFQRLTRGSGRRKLFIAIWAAIFVVTTLLIYRYHTSQRYNNMISSLRKRLIRYCNPPGPVLGNELHEPMEYAQFKLRQVQVVVRHGDRSSVATKFPTASSNYFNCELKSRNPHDSAKIKQLKNMAKIFKKTRMRSDGKHITEDFSLHEAVVCKSGQLTSKGFLQHFYLGEHIYNAYGRKLAISWASAEEKEMLIYATPIERTQQSAAAFLAGMLMEVYKKAKSPVPETFPPVNIQVSPDRLGTFREDENGEIQPCPRLHQVIQRSRQTGSFRNGLLAVERLMLTYSHLFNITRNKLPPITWLGDLVVTHYCHKHAPVCGPNSCVDDKIKAESLKALDWAFTTNYTPPAMIISHPLLSKVFQRMVLKVSEDEPTKFVLYATHDSTVIPVLVTLGIFSKQWVPYTSRIVFELWEARGLIGAKLEGDGLEKYFVRVLFNGRDYTKMTTMCKGSLKFGKLCPLKSFVRFLEGSSQNMGDEYTNLCQIEE